MWPFSASYPEVAFHELREQYDYIIVGGGASGCVLANRLSVSCDKTVLLIERGPVADSWASRVPLLSSDFSSDGSRSQTRMSEYQPELGRPIELVHGSALGGSTRINQMLYTRGLKREYDMWAESGCEGWAWKDVEPFFKRSERFLDGGDDADCHGKKGEWRNRTGPLFFQGFVQVVESCKKLGLPLIDDLNSPKCHPLGCGKLHFTRDENQYRNSAYHAFLPAHLVRQRKNLHVLTNTIAEKVLIGQRTTGPFAEGVQIVSRSGIYQKSVTSGHEIILCGGPFGSPQILMLSGVGPAEHLKEHGIHVYKNLPAVGENLEDHFGVSVAYRIPMSQSLVSLQKRPWVFLIELIYWLIWGTGMLLAPVLQLAIFASSPLLDIQGNPIPEKMAESKDIPDIEIMPMAYDSSDLPFDKSRGVFSFLSVLLHPKSKGNLHLTSSKPDAPLKIDPKYLSNHEDLIPLRASVKLSLRIAEQMRARGYPIEDWKTEMPKDDEDESLDKFIRQRNRSTYHYTSTCRMGPREDIPDGGAVVDEQLKVFGVNGLRVADSSVFPSVLGAHLQAPTVMVAEKCAEMIMNPKSN
ncbi:GMC oxidoreductase [Macrolepiota fuliginosa MF-IS2]|uniref:pyranose dehydrogenase (acceptor) n=1 Tax=Macrolepiota fuliginosa MF-IS2 TaxID=1400762 RepID=A0A9P6C1H2_9AGAR|nr:GMC oxidoreductase [Macrolepiota fuliginosa MF-IS2]